MEEEMNGTKKEEKKKSTKNVGKRIKASFQGRKFKQGAYATVISAVMIVLVLFVNLLFGELDITKDLTADGKYSLTDETINLIQSVNDKITIYYMVQSGSEIDEFKKIISNYEKQSDNVKVVYKDPVQYPKFASNYVSDTISENSFIVVNETTNSAKYIDYTDVLEYQITDYSTYNYQVTGLKIEAKIDAAIQVVTNENLPKIYAVTGHGETGVSSAMSTVLSDGNITSETVNTLTSESIPEDCQVLFINQPQYDFTEDETTMILDYLKSGRDAIICVDFNSNSLPNFMSIVQYYGVDVVEGLVVEGNSNYFRGRYPTELVPDVKTNDFTDGIKGEKYVVSAVSSGLKLRDDIRDTITSSTILETSSDAYSKLDLNSSTVNKETGDIDGPFLLGVSLKETVDEKETNIAIYSGKYMWDDSYIQTQSFGNVDLLYNTINKMCGQENTLSIRTMSLAEEQLVLTNAQKNRNGMLVIVVIPMIFIISGIVVVVRRRKK